MPSLREEFVRKSQNDFTAAEEAADRELKALADNLLLIIKEAVGKSIPERLKGISVGREFFTESKNSYGYVKDNKISFELSALETFIRCGGDIQCLEGYKQVHEVCSTESVDMKLVCMPKQTVYPVVITMDVSYDETPAETIPARRPATAGSGMRPS